MIGVTVDVLTTLDLEQLQLINKVYSACKLSATASSALTGTVIDVSTLFDINVLNNRPSTMPLQE